MSTEEILGIFVFRVLLSELECKFKDLVGVSSEFLNDLLAHDNGLLYNDVISVLFARPCLFNLVILEGVVCEVLVESVLQIEELRDQLRVVSLVLEIIDFLHAFEDLLALWAKSSVKLSKFDYPA